MFKYLPWSEILLEDDDAIASAIWDVQLGSIVIMVLLFALALAATFLVPYYPGANPKDPGIRKRIFWVLGTVVPLGLLLPYIIGCRGLISPDRAQKVPEFYQMTLLVALGAIAVYFIVGYALSKSILKKTKFGDVFGKRYRK